MKAPAGGTLEPGGTPAPDAVPSIAIWNGTRLDPATLAGPAGLHDGALLLDRGLHYGDGLFETIACRCGRPSFLDHHLERLSEGCRRLRIEFTSFDGLRAEIAALAGGAPRAIVKVLVTRGRATARGYAPRGDERPSRIVLRYAWPHEDGRSAHEGIAARISGVTLGENPQLAGLKHLNRLEFVLARADLAGSGFAEALLTSSSGRLVCGTFSNLFLAVGSRLRTPRLDRCGVAGVMRRVVMQLAVRNRIDVEERSLTPADLEAADELFLTNVRIGIWPVHTLGSRVLGVGPVTRRLQGYLRDALYGEHA